MFTVNAQEHIIIYRIADSDDLIAVTVSQEGFVLEIDDPNFYEEPQDSYYQA